MPAAFEPQDALIAVMVAVSAADQRMTDRETASILSIIDLLPVFRGYDRGRIDRVTSTVADLFQREDGLDEIMGMVRAALPLHLIETAYALACDVVAADGRAGESELQLLAMLRDELNLDRLTSAAIERGARARHQRL